MINADLPHHQSNPQQVLRIKGKLIFQFIFEMIYIYPQKAMHLEEQKVTDQISCFYSELQKAYRKWADQFRSYEEIIRWLSENNISESKITRCHKQVSFKLLSSNWNPITIPTLYTLVPECKAKIKNRFDKLFHNRTETQIDRIWYLLYVIHPVRHELYYFDDHYPEGYSFRLARLTRSHRQGLKAAKTYLSSEGRTTNDSFIRACGTTMFKHIHLHPTTCAWEKPNLADIKESILHLEIGTEYLSSNEMTIATALSTKATKSFKRWIGYAPCAINEGPIFTSKGNKKHLDCYKDIVEIFRGHDQNQEIIRAILEEYYLIEV